MPRLLLLVLSAATAFAAEEAVPTHLKVKATFTRPDKDGKPEVYAEPTVITVDGKQATIRVGSAEEGLVFTVTPKVGPDGFLALEMTSSARVSGEPSASPASPPSASTTASSGRAPAASSCCFTCAYWATTSCMPQPVRAR